MTPLIAAATGAACTPLAAWALYRWWTRGLPPAETSHAQEAEQVQRRLRGQG